MYLPRLKELRLEKGLTVQQVAEAVSFPVKTVARHENIGVLKPITYLCSYADLYDVSMDYLMERCEERKPKRAGR